MGEGGGGVGRERPPSSLDPHIKVKKEPIKSFDEFPSVASSV